MQLAIIGLSRIGTVACGLAAQRDEYFTLDRGDAGSGFS
jgi:hypothetical protein